MTAEDAESYHTPQVETFAATAADMITALTLTYPDEAVGIARAAANAGMPVAISFTVETDGRLPNGQPLRDAVLHVDAATSDTPAYFMVNCAHPMHMSPAFTDGGAWLDRIQGLRANASSKSHGELDESEELDEGDPSELAEQYRKLASMLRNVRIVGGCCGTDRRHIAAIASAWPH
jgi:homocysteine S-methyltransferase